jgi:hypothetical protein
MELKPSFASKVVRPVYWTVYIVIQIAGVQNLVPLDASCAILVGIMIRSAAES